MKKLVVQISNNLLFVNPQDIILITRKERKTVIYTVEGTTLAINEPLGRLEQLLDGESFFRCHRGYIINVGMVKEFNPYGNKTYTAKLMNTDETALITVEKAKEFRQRYCIE
ncbi:MAG TPA: LytTR family transcriptional regulator [Desulfitobacterium dehalogenans]|uniref:LytTR family transcriptional regulator n=1 Tax=Desulfitobacterium dehalogenans TaxID=36854 RepID=A0A7C7D7R7_9FIRM|nr:LytTR family transcriptional regulator [Desulfitobacterium dehalogenans]